MSRHLLIAAGFCLLAPAFVLGASKFFAADIPGDSFDWMEAQAKAKGDLICVAYGPESAWLGIAKNETQSANLPPALQNQLANLKTQGSEVKWAAFSPAGGSVILFDVNGYWADAKVPQAVVQQLQALNKAEKEIRQVAFNRDGECVILSETNDYWCSPGIPDKVQEMLASVRKDGQSIDLLAFSPDDAAVLIYDGIQFWGHNQIPAELGKRLLEIAKGGYRIRGLSFTPENTGWNIIYSE